MDQSKIQFFISRTVKLSLKNQESLFQIFMDLCLTAFKLSFRTDNLTLGWRGAGFFLRPEKKIHTKQKSDYFFNLKNQ